MTSHVTKSLTRSLRRGHTVDCDASCVVNSVGQPLHPMPAHIKRRIVYSMLTSIASYSQLTSPYTEAPRLCGDMRSRSCSSRASDKPADFVFGMDCATWLLAGVSRTAPMGKAKPAPRRSIHCQCIFDTIVRRRVVLLKHSQQPNRIEGTYVFANERPQVANWWRGLDVFTLYIVPRLEKCAACSGFWGLFAPGCYQL